MSRPYPRSRGEAELQWESFCSIARKACPPPKEMNHPSTSLTAGQTGGVPRAVWVIALAAFLLRLPLTTTFIPEPNSSSFAYEMGQVSKSLVEGEGLSDPFGIGSGPSAWLTFVFPMIMAGAFLVFGVRSEASGQALYIANSLFSAFTCVVLFCLARRIFGTKPAYFTAGLWAISPGSIFLDVTQLWDTSLYVLAFSFFLLKLESMRGDHQARSYLALGIVLGLVALLRSTILSLAPAVAILLFVWGSGPIFQRARRVLIVGAAAALMLTPWVVRNWVVMGVPGLRSNLGIELRVGNNLDRWTAIRTPKLAADVYDYHLGVSDEEQQRFLEMGEVGYSEWAMDQTKQFVRENPRKFVEITALRIFEYWFGRVHRDPNESVAGLPLGFSITDGLKGLVLPTMALLGFAGAVLSWKRGFGTGTLLAALVLSPIPYYLTLALPRYRYPVDAVLTVFAGLALYTVWVRLREVLPRPVFRA